MNRLKCKAILPVIQAFADGKNIEYWDSLQLHPTLSFHRGMWKTSDDIGFGADISVYRLLEDGMIHYFDGRESIIDNVSKYIF